MCGISGIYGSGDKQEVIERMIDVQKHRGPDDSGIFHENDVWLGHNRLSIIDISSAGHQPMTDVSERYVITFNGEIYNYVEIREELKNKYAFKTRTDTEVILNSYKEWGIKCLDKFIGMFAFAIYDREDKILFGARDHTGIKPFFYSVYKETFYFASEIKALLCAGIQVKQNDYAVWNYLMNGYNDFSSQTFFENVYSLPAGCYFLYTDRNLKIETYWDLKYKIKNENPFAETDSLQYENKIEELNELLYSSIKYQLRSDVPVGIHLSGGLDSSLILGYLDRIKPKGATIKAFTGIFGDDNYDEKVYADKITKSINVDHITAKFEVSEFQEIIEKVNYYQDQVYGGLSTALSIVLDEVVRKNDVIVTLEGQGGDEIFGGYNYYFADYYSDVMRSGDGNGDEILNNYCHRNNIVKETIVLKNRSSANTGLYQDGTEFLKKDCVNKSFSGSFSFTDFPKISDSTFINSRYRDLKYTKIPRVLRYNDIQAMANSVELRVPLLDHRITEFGFNLPLSFFYRDGYTKSFLRDTLNKAKILDSGIIYTPKRSVVNPQREWFSGILAETISERLNNLCLYDLGYLDKDNVLKEFNNFRNSDKPQNSNYIWQWLNLDMWFRNNIL